MDLTQVDFGDVDEFEDARFPEFNKAQQLSTSRAYLAETEYIENRRLPGFAVNRLLSRWASVGEHHSRVDRYRPTLPPIFRLLNFEELDSYNFRYTGTRAM